MPVCRDCCYCRRCPNWQFCWNNRDAEAAEINEVASFTKTAEIAEVAEIVKFEQNAKIPDIVRFADISEVAENAENADDGENAEIFATGQSTEIVKLLRSRK